MKNDKPDAVLYSINEYERLSAVIEYMESLGDREITAVKASIPKELKRREYPGVRLRDDIKKASS